MLASRAVSGGFLAAVALVVALAAWYWDSPWPVALGAAFVALIALDIARGAARHSSLNWSLTRPARPMQMHWSFWVILTERAWDTLGVPLEQRAELQRLLGEYEPTLRRYHFKGHSTPEWMSQPITVRYERWGESLERWTIGNSWITGWQDPGTHHEERVVEFLPAVDEAETVVIWGGWEGPHFRFQDGELFFVNHDENVSVMPDGLLYVKEGARVLFNIEAPTLSMSRGDWQTDEPNPMDRFASPDEPSVDGFGPSYFRHHGQERFGCEDWDKGFQWGLEVHDLRPGLTARIVRVQRSLWRRRVKGICVELHANGTRLIAHPLVVEPTSEGRTIPKKNEGVWVVLNDAGAIDRIWMRS